MKSTRTFSEWAVPSLLALFTAIFLFARFHAGNAYLAFFDDDFFYYLTVARNIVAGHGSTFDGIHRTNGYHPLWMAVNVCLLALFHGRAFFYALLTVMLGSVLFTYHSAAGCFRRYFSANTASYCAAFIAAEFLLIVGGGMEIVLTVPLLAYLCKYRLTRFRWTPSNALLYGLLASLVILSRLDSVLFIATLCLLDLAAATIPFASRVKAAGGFLAGLLPVVVYVGINLVLFHTAVPVSATAKELRTTHAPGFAAFKTALVLSYPIQMQLDKPVLIGVLVAAFLLLFFGSGRLAPEHRPLVWALLLFPFVQLAALSLLSDWPIWDWYLYPFLAAAIGVFLVLGTRQERWLAPAHRFAPLLVGVAALLLAAKSAAHTVRASSHATASMYEIYQGSENLAAFAATHPGTYAMGDRAGMVGYLIHQPLVQLEGLMMDKPFLENIRHQRNVVDTLRAYGVRYYIASNPQPSHGCFSVREPIQAGPTSSAMHGTLCRKPVYQFAYGDFHTYVFDMQSK